MSEDAKDLASSATAGPMVLASTVRATVDTAVAAGLDRAALLARMRIREEDLADPDRAVPLEAQTAAWEALGEHPRAETLALEFAEHFRVDLLGVIGWVMAHAPNAREMIGTVRRYRALFGDPYVPEIEDAPDAFVIHRVFEPRIARTRVMPEYAPASTVVLLRDIVGVDPAERFVRDVWFQHPAPRDVGAHERFFGCRVRFSAPETRIVLAGEVMDRPPRTRDPGLYAYLDRHALALSTTLGERATAAERVRQLVLPMLRAGEPSQGEIARKLGMSERTLQRRLREEGRSFADVLDGVRRELAARYLADPQLAIYEVAFLLGYSDPSSFHRAFRRWTGEGPQEFRVRIRAPG